MASQRQRRESYLDVKENEFLTTRPVFSLDVNRSTVIANVGSLVQDYKGYYQWQVLPVNDSALENILSDTVSVTQKDQMGLYRGCNKKEKIYIF